MRLAIKNNGQWEILELSKATLAKDELSFSAITLNNDELEIKFPNQVSARKSFKELLVGFSAIGTHFDENHPFKDE